MSLSTWLLGATVSEAEVRAEIWSLGARHHGWPLEGARDELAARDITQNRAALLRACVRKLESR